MRPCSAPSSSFVPLPAAYPEDGVDQKISRFASRFVHTVPSLPALDKSKLPVCMVFPQRSIDQNMLLSFLKAADSGEVEVIRGMLDRTFYPDERGYMGRTALLIASRAGHLSVVKLLLDRGANINVFDSLKQTALHEALEQQHQDIIDELLSRKPNIHISDFQGRFPLTIAIEQGQINNIEALVAMQADMNQLYDFFFKSVQIGQERTVRSILDAGFKPDARADKGKTALLIASKLGYLGVVKILLSRGADINAFDHEHRTALHEAIDAKQQHIINFLLSRSPNVNTTDWTGRSPLSMAIELRQIHTVKLLVRIQADVDKVTSDGCPLLLAVKVGCLEIFRQLIPLVDVNQTNKKGQSALHLSAFYGNLTMMKELIYRGVNIDQPGDAGRTPLFCTVFNDRKECFKLLYEKGADLNDTLTRCCISEAHLLRQMEITQASIEKRNFLIAQLSAEWNKLTLL